MLEEERLRRARLVVEVGLSLLAFLAAERWIGKDHVEQLGCAFEEAAIALLAGKCVPVPQVRFVNSVKHEVGQADGVDQVFFFAAPESTLLKGFYLVGRGTFAEVVKHVLEGLGKEPPRSAAWIVDRLTGLRVDDADNDLDDLSGREELSAVVALLRTDGGAT